MAVSPPDPNITFKFPLVEVGGSGTLAVLAATLVVLVVIIGTFYLLNRRATLFAKVARSTFIWMRAKRRQQLPNLIVSHEAPNIVPDFGDVTVATKLDDQRAN